jgi:hypothetical protein
MVLVVRRTNQSYWQHKITPGGPQTPISPNTAVSGPDDWAGRMLLAAVIFPGDLAGIGRIYPMHRGVWGLAGPGGVAAVSGSKGTPSQPRPAMGCSGRELLH